MSFLDILGQFIRIFVDMIPRFASRSPSTDVMVVDSFLIGPHVAKSRPVIYVPILDTVEYWPVTEESVNTDVQSATTGDGVELTIDTGFSYRIIDPLATREWLHESYCTRATMIVRGVVRDTCAGHNFSHLVASMPGSRLHTHICSEISEQLHEYGIELTYFAIEDLARTSNLRHFGIAMQNFTGGEE